MTQPNNQGRAKWEIYLNALSIAAIPIVLAIGSWSLQKSLQDQSIKRDYVQLAVSILKSADTTQSNAGLRDWAVQLLNENSSVKLSHTVQDQLKSGDVSLSSTTVSNAQEINTKANLETLQPKARELGTKLVQMAKVIGIQVVISKGFWSQTHQNMLYAQGRTKKGKIITYETNSMHTKGLAFDVYLIKDGREIDDEESFQKIGAIARSLGLKWSGDLNNDFKNNSHFEVRE